MYPADRKAYGVIRAVEQTVPVPEVLNSSWFIELKRQVRRHCKSFDYFSSSRTIQADSAGYIELVKLPFDSGCNADEVLTWYMDNVHVQYYCDWFADCTGRVWTSWFKLCRRHGAWWAYQRMSIDN